jgi:hypothetical protein
MEVNTVKIISYSLFGDAPIYCIGALRNAEMAKVFYPDWTTLFWVEKESVPTEIITGLLERGADIRPYSRLEWQYGADQEWLWQEVWPKLQQSGLVHDSCTRKQFGGIPFPQSDDPFERFVGEIIDEQEQPNAEHAAIRSHWLARNGDKH